MNLSRRVISDQHVCGGQLVFRGTRITVKTILDSIGEGASAEEILADYPTLSRNDVEAAIQYKPESTR